MGRIGTEFNGFDSIATARIRFKNTPVSKIQKAIRTNSGVIETK